MGTLVTGATGFLGRHLVPLLVARGESLRALVRTGTSEDDLRKLGVEIVRGDLLDEAALRRAAAGRDRIFHLAGVIGYERRDRARQLRVNVDGVGLLLSVAEPDARIVHVSSVAAIGPVDGPEERADEDHPYPARADRYVYPYTKRLGERLALDAAAEGRDVVVACPGFFLGPGDVHRVNTWPVWRYLQGTLRVLVAGGLSYVDARDVAAGLIALSERGRAGERTILTHPAGNLTHRDFYRRVADVTGARRRQFELPASVAVSGARVLPFPVRPGEAAAAANWWFFDPAKAERELGFRARPLGESILDTAAQYL